jgi:hypothetical protein
MVTASFVVNSVKLYLVCLNRCSIYNKKIFCILFSGSILMNKILVLHHECNSKSTVVSMCM